MNPMRGVRPALGLSLVVACLPAAPGCVPDQTAALLRERNDAREQLKKAWEQNLSLQEQLRRREEQVAALQALGAGRLERLFTVQRVRIGGNSCGIGEANAPGDKGVKVYLEPLDRDGVSLKAAGDVTIELYDLGAPPADNLLSTFRYTAEDAGGKWTQGFMSQFYIFECKWGAKVPRHKDLTVRVVFVDYLTGKTFTDQRVVEVALPLSVPAATSPASAPTTAPATGPASIPTTGPMSVPATGPASTPTTGPMSVPATAPAGASQKAGP